MQRRFQDLWRWGWRPEIPILFTSWQVGTSSEDFANEPHVRENSQQVESRHISIVISRICNSTRRELKPKSRLNPLCTAIPKAPRFRSITSLIALPVSDP